MHPTQRVQTWTPLFPAGFLLSLLQVLVNCTDIYRVAQTRHLGIISHFCPSYLSNHCHQILLSPLSSYTPNLSTSPDAPLGSHFFYPYLYIDHVNAFSVLRSGSNDPSHNDHHIMIHHQSDLSSLQIGPHPSLFKKSFCDSIVCKISQNIRVSRCKLHS